jgi:hypothetical protein
MNDTNLIEDLRLLAPPDHRWAVALALAGAALAVLTWWWRRLRHARPAPSPLPTPSGSPPWEIALAEHERLAALLRPETSRDYGIASTTVLRRYLEERYGLQAPRLATEEFLAVASRTEALPTEHRQSLDRFLRLCDFLKFGRYTASAGELRGLHTAALAFVMASRPAEDAGPAGGAREAALPVSPPRHSARAFPP